MLLWSWVKNLDGYVPQAKFQTSIALQGTKCRSLCKVNFAILSFVAIRPLAERLELPQKGPTVTMVQVDPAPACHDAIGTGLTTSKTPETKEEDACADSPSHEMAVAEAEVPQHTAPDQKSRSFRDGRT